MTARPGGLGWEGLDTDEGALDAASVDFGRVVRRRPRAIARPTSAEEIAEIIRAANREEFPVTVRGAGHSQGGQSLSEGGVLVDMTGLDRIGDVGAGEMWAQSGARWRDVVHRAYAEGYLPLALTTHLSVTVGGTLSVAGLSETTHTYGPQTDSATELEVVTGDGRRLRCSPSHRSELFHCALCGQGQFGAITEARIRLRRVLPNVRLFSLVYDDVAAFMGDMELVMEREYFQYIDAWCLPAARDVWQRIAGTMFARRVYVVNLIVEWDGTPPGPDEALEGLNYALLKGCADHSTIRYVTRTEGRTPLEWFEDWGQAHPSMEGILPWESFAGFMAEAFTELPGSVARTARVMLGPFRNERFHSPLLMRPDTEMLMGFGILIEVPAAGLQEVLPVLSEASDRLVAAGGKRYLSSWVDFTLEQWVAHFGEQWPRMVAWKREFDPRGVLNPAGLPLSRG